MLIVSRSGPIVVFATRPVLVNLGSASNFVIHSEIGISTTGLTSVFGDMAKRVGQLGEVSSDNNIEFEALLHF